MITHLLTQVMEKPAKESALLYLTLTIKEELVSSVKVKVSLGCSNGETRMVGKLVTKDMEKVKVLSGFFTLFFTGKICLQESQNPETSGNVWSKK